MAQDYGVDVGTCMRVKEVFEGNYTWIKAFLAEISPFCELHMELKKTVFIFPNAFHHGPDLQNFWEESLLEMFIYDGWQNKQVEIANAREIKTKLKELEYGIKQLGEQAQGIEDEAKLILVINQIENLREEKRKYEENMNFDIFQIVNNNEEELSYQLNLHYLSVKEAKKKFQEYYLKILCDLKSGRIKNNMPTKNNHILKVICGFGHGRQG